MRSRPAALLAANTWPAVQARLAAIKTWPGRPAIARHRFEQRAGLDLAFPTTTIGSFRRRPRRSAWPLVVPATTSGAGIKGDLAKIRHAVQIQEQLGLDVLVHGEAERNDMVEYFAEQLDGYVFALRLGAGLSRCLAAVICAEELGRPPGRRRGGSGTPNAAR